MRYRSLLVFMLLFSVVLGCGGGGSAPLSGDATVDPGGAGSAALTWNAPNTNTDGSPLNDLTGFKVYYGRSSGSYNGSLDVGLVTAYSLGNLSPGTYYMVVTAYNAAGNESMYSNEVAKTVL